MAFPTAIDPADRAVGPLSPLPCQAWHGYGVYSAHHGEVRGCRRACERTPLRSRRRCAAGGRRKLVILWLCVSVSLRDELLAAGRPGSAEIAYDRGDNVRVKVGEARHER
jgi:hypothetical protein